MKRVLVLTALSLAAVVATTSIAGAQAPVKKVSPLQVTSKTTPKRDRKRPYKFTTTGKVVPPPVCPTPGAGNGTCVPLVCPAGATNPAYCLKPTPAALCSGKVKIVFKKRRRTVSSRSVALRPNCTFRSRAKIRRKARLKVSTRFGGNTYLLPKNGPRSKVRAG